MRDGRQAVTGSSRQISGKRVRTGALCAFLSIIFFSLVFASQVLAVIANPEPVTLVQPDGSVITVVLRGDEYMHWNEDESGYLITRSADSKWWVYAREEFGRIMPTEHIVGRADASLVGIKHDISMLRPKGEQRPMLDSSGIEKAPAATGTLYNLVVLVNYTDLAVTSTTAEFDDLFNQIGYTADGATGSVKDYYNEVSYNTLDLQSVVVEPVTISQGYAYYGENDKWGYDLHPREMVTEALAALEARGFDFSTVDGDSDGWIDGLTIIHAGGGEEWGGNDPDYIWSHQWTLSSVVNYDGVNLYYYHTEPSRRGWDDYPSTWGITRIGVICHETGHFLGLPDLYDYGYDSEGAGNFCLMAGGSWNGNYGSTPSHLSGWCKVDLGWVTPTLITGGGSYPLSQVETNTEIYKLQGGFASNEYFLVENRQGVGFDADLPGTLRGLLIWHVDENQPDNDDQTHYLVDLEEASGTQHLQLNQNAGDDLDYFRSGNMTGFTGTTTPNNLSYSLVPLGLDISAVSSTGSVMSFLVNAMTIALDSPDGGEVLEGDQIHQISWAITGFAPDSVGIYLSLDSGGNFDIPVETGITAGTAYDWTVPNLSTTTARIKVIAYAGDSEMSSDFSAGDFTINFVDLEAPAVTVVYPNGGETFVSGDPINIEWIALDNVQIDSVSIYYSENGGGDYILLASSEPNDSLYEWAAPDIDSDMCLVKVVAFDPALLTGEDTSDDHFAVSIPTGDDDIPVLGNYLRQNYPNPFNPNTRISFSISSSSA
ncbi:MAG: M6 family metalloprotease domain-containing protein, partial [Candidatus Krumholzibacteriota bacterium]|nr:M6 family metalloprotease domain-containing protein [Candidatus Krumholzibacteriota bacterium]